MQAEALEGVLSKEEDERLTREMMERVSETRVDRVLAPKDHVLFDRHQLVRQRQRITELEDECKREKINFKELHRVRSKLDRSKVQLQAQIEAQQAKYVSGARCAVRVKLCVHL